MLQAKQELLAALAAGLEQLSPGAGAKAAFERALQIFYQFLGQNHPSTVTVRNNLEYLERQDRGDDA